jgi:putative PIN family toxin of toxin-antitoxin system
MKKPRIVLDTNVCLDLFVFRDPRWQHLLSAMQQDQVECVTSSSCRMEWTLVLNYKKLALTEVQQQSLLAEFDALIHVIPDDEASIDLLIKLPLCRDKDDQKFLVLAYTAQADFLITKDKALLKLARKTSRLGLFAIATPEAWTKLYEPSA